MYLDIKNIHRSMSMGEVHEAQGDSSDAEDDLRDRYALVCY